MLSILPLLFPLAACPQDDPTAIREADLRAHIGFLASDELEGRESGARGGHLAAEYFAKQWLRLGLEPLTGSTNLQEKRTPKDFYLPFKLRNMECFNTAGMLAGTDPKLADQVIVIGGHHDHAGIGGPGAMGFPGEIHNGADDNASGSSGVAELAEYFVKNPLRRPILFMTFSAEERGLLGSADFVKNGPLATENMYVMLNCDMIGRSRGYLFVGGLGTALELNETLEDLLDGKRLGLELELSQSGEAPSDNTSFYRADVPALFFFTNIHDDYHMPGDDADKIDYAGEVKVLELIRDIAGSLDQRDDRLTFQTAPGMGMPADFNDRMMSQYGKIAERAKNRGRLGINADSSEGGLLISRVREESAAARAGLQVGDVLVSLNGRATTDKEQLRRAMGGKLKGEVVTAVFLRAGNEHNIEITLQ